MQEQPNEEKTIEEERHKKNMAFEQTVQAHNIIHRFQNKGEFSQEMASKSEEYKVLLPLINPSPNTLALAPRCT